MASNFFKVDKGVTLAPQSSIASPQNGDVYYDSTRNTYVFRNNGASVDLQSRSDVGTASSLTSANFTATVIQSNLIKLTGSTVSNIHGITASSDAKMIVLYNGSSAVVTIKNASGTESTAGNRILTSTGADVNLNAGEAVQLTYDSTQARWIVVSTPGGSASGGTGKNYLTTYKNNPGNGNFESASTTGWSLGTTGTLTNGLPTGSPTFGSGASGNLSISTVSSGQLAGSYSLSYASSAATTQGNMLASDAFSIDLEDQAKVLTWKFYYKAQTNSTNANWSGTSSNSFGVAVYDVTNSTWLPVTGQFSMTQSSGVGISTGTFQTASTSVQLRFVLYNVNATSGAITLYLDDVSVGPQTIVQAQLGPVGQIIATGSLTPPMGFLYANGSAISRSLYADLFAVIGTTYGVGDGSTTFNLPNLQGIFARGAGSQTISGVSYTSTLGASQTDSLQQHTHEENTGTATQNHPFASSGSSLFAKAVGSAATVNNANSNGNVLNGRTDTETRPANVAVAYHIQYLKTFSISNDSDTRVVAARFSTNTARATNNTSPTIVYDITEYDSHGSYNNATGSYTVPVTGFYDVFGYFASTTHVDTVGFAFNLHVYRNGVFHSTVAGARVYTTASAIVEGGGSSQIFVNAGDVLTFRIYSDTTTTLAINRSGANFVALTRRSGPSVIAATESVNARYTNSSGQTIANATITQINSWTRDFDSHNAFASNAYVVPVSGKYQVNIKLLFAGTSMSTGGVHPTAYIYVNGTAVSSGEGTAVTNASEQAGVNMSDIINVNAGDSITVRLQHSNGGNRALITIGTANTFSISRVGN